MTIVKEKKRTQNTERSVFKRKKVKQLMVVYFWYANDIWWNRKIETEHLQRVRLLMVVYLVC